MISRSYICSERDLLFQQITAMQQSKKKSVSVKDKLDGNEIDLSLLELTEVPVKELVLLTLRCINANNTLIVAFSFFSS